MNHIVLILIGTVALIAVVVGLVVKLNRAERTIFELRGDAKHFYKLAGGLEAELEEANARLAKFDGRSRERDAKGRFIETPAEQTEVEGAPI